MKIAAIIAEYNPFHNGHSYQISETRRQTDADYILVIMSGNFVQRGTPAICNKYVRTKMALLGGADAVIELPSLYATSSAEFFAQGAVTLIENLQAVDFLSFGSECANLPLLQDTASILLSESNLFKSSLNDALKLGCSFPAARIQAIRETLSSDTSNTEIAALLSSPNNILGVEYCKALLSLKSTIQPFTIMRQGNGYHDASLSTNTSHFASASAIRENLTEASIHMPAECFQLLKDEIESNSLITEDSFSQLLFYKLLSEKEYGFAQYLDCTPDLSDKICSQLSFYTGFSDFCRLLKSKDLTYSRISRMLLHILLDLKTPDSFKLPPSKRKLFLPYARLLGFRKDSCLLLKKIKQNSQIPLLSKLADAKYLLSEDALSFLKQDIFCSSVYETASCMQKRKTALNEFRQSPIIIP